MLSGRMLWDDNIVSDMMVVKHRAGYHLTYPSLPANMYEVLLESAGHYGAKPAIIEESGRAYTYFEVLGLVDAFAAHLHAHCHVRKGSQVGILLPNGVDFAVAFLALSKLAAVSVPLDIRYPARELATLLGMANLKLLLADARCRDAFASFCCKRGIQVLVREEDGGFGFPLESSRAEAPKPSHSGRLAAARRPGLEDHALLMFTSGTTAVSKGALISNLNLMHAVVSYERILALGPDDQTASCQPMCHITGLAAILCLFLRIGGSIRIQKARDMRRTLQLVEESGITFLHLTPPSIIEAIGLKNDFPSMPSLKMCAFGGSNLPAKFMREMKSWLPGVSFRPVYGLTESTSPVAIFPSDAAGSFRIGSSGMPIPGVMVKVVDETGREQPDGMIGELCVRGADVIDGYYQNEFGFDGEGWFRTGDMARLTGDGHVYIMDRRADVITRDGEKIWSFEIENLLHECPGVKEAVVVGMPDAGCGEAVAALLTAESGGELDPGCVAVYLEGKITRNKMPTLMRVADRLPMTPAGKIDKAAVGRMFR